MSSVTFYSLEETLWEMSDRLMEQYQRHYMIRVPGKATSAAVTPFVTPRYVRPEVLAAYREKASQKFLTAAVGVDQALFKVHNQLSIDATGKPLTDAPPAVPAEPDEWENNPTNPLHYAMEHDSFQLTDGDIEILRFVHELRIAHIDHIAALCMRSYKALARRILKLYYHRYLACITKRPQKHVYAIGTEGVPVLIEHGYAPSDIGEKRLRHAELKDLAIKHFLHVVGIHTSF